MEFHYRFTPEEDQQITALRTTTQPPVPYKIIGRKLHRSKGSVIGRAIRLGIRSKTELVMTPSAIRKRQRRAEKKARGE